MLVLAKKEDLQPDPERGEDHDDTNHGDEYAALNGRSQLGGGHISNSLDVGHRELSCSRSVRLVKPVGQVAAAASRLSTSSPRSRRQTSQRLLRLREAAGVSQLELATSCLVSRRAIGCIERAEVRIVALDGFLKLLDYVLETQGVQAVLAAILTDEQRRKLALQNDRLMEVA